MNQELIRQGFDDGSGSTEIVHEPAAQAIAAREAAAVQARFVVALRRPRDLDIVRQRLLRECKRPGFAEVARYRKPIGKGVEGPSIRFVEAALRELGNVITETATVFDDDERSIIRTTVSDLETNATYSVDTRIEKTVERRNAAGYEVIRERTNKNGDRVFIVRATDDDLLNKTNALISKALRTLGLRLIPGDIVEECQAQVLATRSNRAATDPDGERKKLLAAFDGLGVSAADLKAYVGKSLSRLSPPELVELRSLFTAIRDGEATFDEAVRAREEENAKRPEGDDDGDDGAEIPKPVEKAPEPAPVPAEAPAEPIAPEAAQVAPQGDDAAEPTEDPAEPEAAEESPKARGKKGNKPAAATSGQLEAIAKFPAKDYKAAMHLAIGEVKTLFALTAQEADEIIRELNS